MNESISNPFAEALESVIGIRPPFDLDHVFSSSDICDDVFIKLQDWCALHARPSWATGISMIEAADIIVDGAICNSNIQKRTQEAGDA